MDGTCLDGRSRMTDEVLEALREVAANGTIVVPCTGRNLECIPHRLAAGVLYESNTADDEKNHDLYRYVITSNGARVTELILGTKKKKTIFRAEIPMEQSLRIIRECEKHKIAIAAHVNHHYLAQGKMFAAAGRVVYGKDAAGVYCARNVGNFIEKNRHDVEELQFYFPGAKAEECLRKILSNYPDVIAAYSDIYAEVFSVKASKGNGLKAIAEHLSIAKEEIACIGDGENDLPMFRQAGLKIAMGNAVAELKEQADYITGTNRENGVAQAIQQWIL